MKIHFRLAWVKAGKVQLRSFKAASAHELFYEYLTKISKFTSCEVSGFDLSCFPENTKGKLWICDRGKDAKVLSSEDLAVALSRTRDSGVRELNVVIGSADGFNAKELALLKPDLKWSFGPLTLPHEIAAIVAGEQIYRAYSILNHLPYHLGH